MKAIKKKNMKKYKYHLLITIIFFFSSISCIKKENIFYEKEGFLHNNIADTLILKITMKDNSNKLLTFYPNQRIKNYYKSQYDIEYYYFFSFKFTSKIEIFKNSDTNNLFIGFYKDNLPYNYKKNIFSYPNDWEKDSLINWNSVTYIYTFSISYDNLINR